MSLALATGDLLNVRLEYDDSGATGIGYNVLHYKIAAMSGTPPAVDTGLAAIGQAVYTLLAPLWAVAAAAVCRMTGVTVVDVFPVPRSVAVTYTPGTAQVGGVAGDALPLQDSPTLLKKTAVGQRWGMGRLFFYGLAEGDAHDGYVEGIGAIAGLSAFAAALANIVTATNGGWTASLQPVLVTKPEDNPVRITNITSGRLSNVIIKSQKRRRPGKGI